MNYLAEVSAEVISNHRDSETSRILFFSIGGSLALLGGGAVIYGIGRGVAAVVDKFGQRRRDIVEQLSSQDTTVGIDHLAEPDFEKAAQQWSDIVAIAGILKAHETASSKQPETGIFMCGRGE